MAIIRRIDGEIAVNMVTQSGQFDPAVGRLAHGGFAIAWTDNSNAGADWDSGGIKAQLFDAAGARVGGEFEVNTQIRGSQASSSVAGLASGNFVVAWTSNWPEPGDDSGTSVQARLFDASGNALGAQFIVNSSAVRDQISPTITALASGGFLIGWQDYSAAGGPDIRAQRFDSAGAKVGGEIAVNTTLAGFQGGAAAVELASGGLLLAWTDSNSTDGDIRGRLFDAQGNPVGDDFLINTVVAYAQNVPDVAALPGGGFVATWQSREVNGDQFNGGYRVKAQVFAADGRKVGSEILVATATQVSVLPTSPPSRRAPSSSPGPARRAYRTSSFPR